MIVPPARACSARSASCSRSSRSTETAPFLHLAAALPLAAAEAELSRQLADRIAGDASAATRARSTSSAQADAALPGQAFELTVPLPARRRSTEAAVADALPTRFEAEHLARYGHAFSGEFPVEIVNLRLVGHALAEGVEPSFACEPGQDHGPIARERAGLFRARTSAASRRRCIDREPPERARRARAR